MALATFGSNAQTNLRALVMDSNLTIADGATFRANVKYDGSFQNGTLTAIQGNAVYPGGFEFQGGQGLLYVPRRGVLQVLPGDYIAYDTNGWPILVSAWSIATGSQWVHS